jgi:hypothetical protein
MLVNLLALLAGIFGGALAGGLVGRRLFRRHSGRVSLDSQIIDPKLDYQINQAARRWAEAHHQPAAARLVAGKLRLAYSLNRQRGRRPTARRWFR